MKTEHKCLREASLNVTILTRVKVLWLAHRAKPKKN